MKSYGITPNERKGGGKQIITLIMSSHLGKRKVPPKNDANRENKRSYRIVGLQFLPPEILSEIVSYLGLVDIVNTYSSCKNLRHAMLTETGGPVDWVRKWMFGGCQRVCPCTRQPVAKYDVCTWDIEAEHLPSIFNVYHDARIVLETLKANISFLRSSFLAYDTRDTFEGMIERCSWTLLRKVFEVAVTYDIRNLLDSIRHIIRTFNWPSSYKHVEFNMQFLRSGFMEMLWDEMGEEYSGTIVEEFRNSPLDARVFQHDIYMFRRVLTRNDVPFNPWEVFLSDPALLQSELLDMNDLDVLEKYEKPSPDYPIVSILSALGKDNLKMKYNRAKFEDFPWFIEACRRFVVPNIDFFIDNVIYKTYIGRLMDEDASEPFRLCYGLDRFCHLHLGRHADLKRASVSLRRCFGNGNSLAIIPPKIGMADRGVMFLPIRMLYYLNLLDIDIDVTNDPHNKQIFEKYIACTRL